MAEPTVPPGATDTTNCVARVESDRAPTLGCRKRVARVRRRAGFELGAIPGQGGMGIVRRAQQRTLDRAVALLEIRRGVPSRVSLRCAATERHKALLSKL